MDEQRLERALRQGPLFATRYVPSALALDEQPIVRGPVSVGRLMLIIAVTALLLVGLLAGLAALGGLQDDDGPASNGWVAFVVEGDIYLVREGEAARRIIGSDSDGLDQFCPAFSPDGRRLAHGEADGTADTGYHDAVLVISDLDAEGNASESQRIHVGGTLPPPCAIWSADGRRVAFGVPLTSPVNPDRSAAGSEVWVATVADGHVDVLPDVLATDLEWSPDGSQLAIASGQTDLVPGESLRDGSIRLYDADSGEMRTLVGPSGVSTLTWSPDGSRIAYQLDRSGGGVPDNEIWVVHVDGSGEYLLADSFGSIRGIGPVWSPTGDRIVYLRMTGAGEGHEVVLVTPDGESEVRLPALRLPGTDAPGSWRPSGVTWSPDGRELLIEAWSYRDPPARDALVLVSVDQESEPVVLHEDDNISRADEYLPGPIQSWGRHPDE